MGVMYKPERLTLRCIYPTDSASDVRDDAGCGPFLFDTRYGSLGASRTSAADLAEARAWMRNYSSTHYPGCDWRHIDCQSYFSDPYFSVFFNATTWRAAGDSVTTCEAMKRSTGRPPALEVQSLQAVYEQQQGAISGTPLCTDTTPARGFWWEYVGVCSWAPYEWQAMVDAMNAWFPPPPPPSSSSASSAPRQTLLWNELIAAQPSSLAEEASLARALFYMVTPQTSVSTRARLRDDARQNVAMWSRASGQPPLPVLEMDTTRLGRPDLLRCAEDA